MAWSPWIELGEHQTVGYAQGVYPQYVGGWRLFAQAEYPEDTTFFSGRLALTWGAAGLANYIGRGWSWFTRAVGVFEDGFWGTKKGDYTSTKIQGVSITRLLPTEAQIDLITEAYWQAYVAAEGLVLGVDYVTPPEAQRYKTYDWVPDGPGSVVPGGFLGLSLWASAFGGTSPAETPGYFGADFELRVWNEIAPSSLPFFAGNLQGNPVYDLGSVIGPWPGHYTAGELLFSWDRLAGAAFDGDANNSVHYTQSDVLHAMDLLSLSVDGHLGIIHTSDIFDGPLPPYTPGLTPPTEGGDMGIFGANTWSSNMGSVVIPRCYPRILLPNVRYWKPSIPPLRLRARDDDSGTPTSGAEPSPRILVRSDGMRDRTASVQQSRRIFYGPGTYA